MSTQPKPFDIEKENANLVEASAGLNTVERDAAAFRSEEKALEDEDIKLQAIINAAMERRTVIREIIDEELVLDIAACEEIAEECKAKKESAEHFVRLRESICFQLFPEELQVTMLEPVFKSEEPITTFQQVADFIEHPFAQHRPTRDMAAQIFFRNTFVFSFWEGKKIFNSKLPELVKYWLKKVEIVWQIKGSGRMWNPIILCNLEQLDLKFNFSDIDNDGKKIMEYKPLQKLVERLPMECQVSVSFLRGPNPTAKCKRRLAKLRQAFDNRGVESDDEDDEMDENQV